MNFSAPITLKIQIPQRSLPMNHFWALLMNTMVFMFIAALGYRAIETAAAQTFTTGRVDYGDGTSNVFSNQDLGPDGKIYGMWRDGAQSATTGVAAAYKVIRWNSTTSAWDSVSSFLFQNIPGVSTAYSPGDDMGFQVDASGGFHFASVVPMASPLGNAVMYGYSANGTSWSFTQLVNLTGTNDSPGKVRLELDQNNRPRVFFLQRNVASSTFSSKIFTLWHYSFNGSSWTSQKAYEQNGGAGTGINSIDYISAVVDGAGKAHIAFGIESNGSGTDASLAYITNASGTWSTPLILAQGTTGNSVADSMAISVGPSDKLHIISRDKLSNLVYHTNVTGSWIQSQITGANLGTLDAGSMSATSMKPMAVNSNGDVLLTYRTSGFEVKYACLFKDSSTWQFGSIMQGSSRTAQFIALSFLENRQAMVTFDHFSLTGNPANSPNNPRELHYATATILPPGPSLPSISTATSSSISYRTATLGATVNNNGGGNIAERGIVYSVTSTNGNPLVGGNGVVKATSTGTTGSFNVEVAGLAAATQYTFKGYVTNEAGTSYTSATTFTTMTAPAPIEAWRQQYFGSQTNLGNGANTYSPTGDGVVNLLKYALVLDPLKMAADKMPAPQFITVGGKQYLSISLTRDPTRTDITIDVQAGSDLLGWTVVASSVAGATFTGPGFVQESDSEGAMKIVVLRDTIETAGEPRRFMRVRAVHPILVD